MRLRSNAWRKAAGGFRTGDLVVVDKRLRHADMHTPKLGAICEVIEVDARPGNMHPIHIRQLNDPRREDWVNTAHIYLLERRGEAQ